MKIEFSKVIFAKESRGTLDESDGWAKRWILFNSDALVTKRRQQGGSSVLSTKSLLDHSKSMKYLN